jgi:type VI secretion system secreted protein VgrG
MKLKRRRAVIGLPIFMAVALCGPPALFAGVITLGAAQSFAVLSGAGVAINGACCTVVSGNLGDYPLDVGAITGIPTPGSLINGSVYAADRLPLIAQQARADETLAYNALALLTSTGNESGTILGTGGTVSTLLPGVYTFNSSAQVNGALTLNFNGESNAAFVFLIGTTLITGAGAAIHAIGANSTDSIYWRVGDSATLGTGALFAGNILALNAITLNTGASIACGRALAYTASVTMAGTNFVSDDCSLYNTLTGYSSAGPTDFGSLGFSGASQTAETPEPANFLLLTIGLTGLMCRRRTQRVPRLTDMP